MCIRDSAYSVLNSSDQLEIRDYRLSATRIEPGGRADGVVVFDRPSFKESTEKLFLQIAQADQVDRPILIRPVSYTHLDVYKRQPLPCAN